jgi:hypothetical protein
LYLPLLLLKKFFRNEQYQEELWRMSFVHLKDHLSPETVEKYGPKPEPPSPSSAAAEPSSTNTTETPHPAQEGGPGGAGGGEGSAVVEKREDVSADPDEPKERGEESATNDATASS